MCDTVCVCVYACVYACVAVTVIGEVTAVCLRLLRVCDGAAPKAATIPLKILQETSLVSLQTQRRA